MTALVMVAIAFQSCLSNAHLVDGDDISAGDPGVEIGKARFYSSDFGGIKPATLKSNAFVFKAVVLALILRGDDTQIEQWDSQASFDKLFKPYGFLYSETIWNEKEYKANRGGKPSGIVSGYSNGYVPPYGKIKLEISNLGCATCHGGVLYDKSGKPTEVQVLGLPNTSLNLNAFASDIYQGYKKMVALDKPELKTWFVHLFPEIEKSELKGLLFYVKGLRKEIRKMEAASDQVTPYDLGGAGATNGIGSIKRVLGLMDPYEYHASEAAIVSVPELSDRQLRSSLLASGNYAPKSMAFFQSRNRSDEQQHLEALAGPVAMFTIGALGFSDKMAVRAIPDVKQIMRFLGTYVNPDFPGDIEQAKAIRGRTIYIKKCESCHGKYQGQLDDLKLVSFPNKAIPVDIIRTDPLRAASISDENIEYLQTMRLHQYISAQNKEVYVAPILNGLWATAPYLHNGSVPTIWHLMNPDSRPVEFHTGGHELDYEKMGIKGVADGFTYRYPDGYTPWADPEIYDTRRKGRANSGHEFPFDQLDEDDKYDLIEFLKLL